MNKTGILNHLKQKETRNSKTKKSITISTPIKSNSKINELRQKLKYIRNSTESKKSSKRIILKENQPVIKRDNKIIYLHQEISESSSA